MAISGAGILNLLAPRGRHGILTDIAYGDGPRRRLDVYVPRPGTRAAPTVIFFYGGSWEGGDRGDYRFLGSTLARRGLTVIVPDYRVYPEVSFPAFIDDAAEVVRWARDHAVRHGGDPSRLILMGHSAGAHLGAMLAFDRRRLQTHGLNPAKDLAGFIGLAGPYDFLPLRSRTLKAIFGPDERLPTTQPINFIDGKAPPAFLAAARDDRLVDPGNTIRLARRIREAGGRVEEVLYDRVNHATLIGAFAAPLRFMAPVLADTLRFIRTVTAGGAPHPQPTRKVTA